MNENFFYLLNFKNNFKTYVYKFASNMKTKGTPSNFNQIKSNLDPHKHLHIYDLL